MASQNTDGIAASLTTLEMLETLKEMDGAGVTELSQEMGLAKSTVHSHLATLQEKQYVVREGDMFNLGLRFLEFGEFIRTKKHIYNIARPEVDKLAEETGELANLAVEEHGVAVFLYRAHGDQAVRLDTYAGMRSHLHCSALGKAILAHRPEKEVSAIVDRHGLPKRTESTITEEDELHEELQVIRDRGYAYDTEERLAGLYCAATPITDRENGALGAISIAGPTSRMQGERFDGKIPDLLLNAKNVIELNMAFS